MTTKFLKFKDENDNSGYPLKLIYINTNDIAKIEMYCDCETDKEEFVKIYLKNNEIITMPMSDDLFERINDLSYEDTYKLRRDLIKEIKDRF